MHFNLQPLLENEQVILYPLQEEDFESLYAVASDPLIWEQHPNKDRWQKDVFRIFFDGALMSEGAFKIVDKKNRQVIGSTRFYDYDPQNESILIGYTFYGRDSWGKGINQGVKVMMLDYILQFVQQVHFHIGTQNIRSQIAIERLGVQKVDEQEIAYFGEPPRQNYIYCITRAGWRQQKEHSNTI